MRPRTRSSFPTRICLFDADFKRSGVDLILSKDDHELVLHDYFKGEKRAPAGLARRRPSDRRPRQRADRPGPIQPGRGAADASPRSSATSPSCSGSATAIRNGVSIILHQGDNVEKGDVVQSGSDSTLGVTFIDGTVFGLSSNARMVLNEMVYDPNGSNNSSLISLVAGTISFVAGETAKHGDMKIDTPVATMGIRGTAVLVEIDFTVPGQGGTSPTRNSRCWSSRTAPPAPTSCSTRPRCSRSRWSTRPDSRSISATASVIPDTSPLSPDLQKLITDVFSQKFTDNTNTEVVRPFHRFGVPQTFRRRSSGADGTIVQTVTSWHQPNGSSPTPIS